MTGVFTKIQFGDGLMVTPISPGVIRVDGAGGVGPAGPSGPTGPPGAAGTLYTHVQSGLSSSWLVVHNLGSFPSVTVVDTGGTEVIPNLHYDNSNQITLTFAAPTSGTAYLN
jgi:hypothetical protein